ncbi:hypothetical protein GGS26DRAFT_557974 [Hypomontagnella submonticulosa]|nr:hypothetical protein GGS26DRAFT_557974 [Hypomontagnella submonticulosa]
MSPLPAAADHSAAPSSSTILTRAVFHLLTARADDDAKCHPSPNIDLCEKPELANHTSEIVIGTLGGVVAVITIATLAFFHFRRQRADAREWPKNNQELDDYGVGPLPSSSAPRKPKNAYQAPRVDAVDDAGEDYDSKGRNLPPPVRRDSLQSLARSLRGNPDAYRSRPDDTSLAMKPVEPVSQL